MRPKIAAAAEKAELMIAAAEAESYRAQAENEIKRKKLP